MLTRKTIQNVLSMGKTMLLTLVLALLLGPYTVLGQASMSSSTYEIDSINFGTNFTLTTGQATTPPSISSEGPSVIELTPTTAKIFWKTDKASSSTVQFGKTDSYGQEIGTSELSTEHTVTLLGLTPETTYHYRAKSVDAFGGSGVSGDKTFTTPAEAGINSIKISDIGYDRALISWTTGLFTRSQLEYGTTTKYGLTKEVASRSFVTSHTLQLTGLSTGTDYHFRIVAEDEEGNISRSNDFLFTTIAEPRFISISAQTGSEANQVTITWRTNVFASGIVTYKSDQDDKALTAGDGTLTASHSMVLKNLFGLTTYTYSITATDAQGRQVKSGDQTFKTPTDSSPPVISGLKVSVTRSGETLVMTATWKTNEPTKNKVSFNPKTNVEQVTELPETTSFTTEHVSVSSGLKPSTPYALQVIATDPFGNQSQQTINFVSPNLRRSIIQLILDSILRPFGWLAALFD